MRHQRDMTLDDYVVEHEALTLTLSRAPRLVRGLLEEFPDMGPSMMEDLIRTRLREAYVVNGQEVVAGAGH